MRLEFGDVADVLRNDPLFRVSGRASSPPFSAKVELRNTLPNVVRDTAEPLTEIREIFAENRLDAIAVARGGFL